MSVFKCKRCGGSLLMEPAGHIGECEYCGTRQTVPADNNEKKTNLYNRAQRLFSNHEFDKAAAVYESIVSEFPEEPEAYWGIVLCRYGIEYVDDPATGRKVPTCHRLSYREVLSDGDFEQALEYADPDSRRLYREEAKELERIREGILSVSAKEEPYDIFISYKETDDKGNRTLDSVLAQDVYDALTRKGYRVFFSRISLEDKLGQEYEPYIFAALNSAKVMLVFGTDYEYFNAVWVRNEWSRFLALMGSDPQKFLIPCYKDIEAYDMPSEFRRLQAQDLGKIGAVQDLLRGIEKLIGSRQQSREDYIKELEQKLAGLAEGKAAIDRMYEEKRQEDLANSDFSPVPLTMQAITGCLDKGDQRGAVDLIKENYEMNEEEAARYCRLMYFALHGDHYPVPQGKPPANDEYFNEIRNHVFDLDKVEKECLKTYEEEKNSRPAYCAKRMDYYRGRVKYNLERIDYWDKRIRKESGLD